MGARIHLKDLPESMQKQLRGDKKVRKNPVAKMRAPLRGTPHKMVGIRLPMPPSVNLIYRPGEAKGSRFLTKEAKAFREAVGEACMEQGIGHVIGEHISIVIWMYGGGSDVDNALKATLDALQAARVFDDDKFIDRLSINKAALTSGGPYLSVQLEGDMPCTKKRPT